MPNFSADIKNSQFHIVYWSQTLKLITNISLNIKPSKLIICVIEVKPNFITVKITLYGKLPQRPNTTKPSTAIIC